LLWVWVAVQLQQLFQLSRFDSQQTIQILATQI